MNIDANLRERLLELIYGLLPDDDAEQLRRRIAQEPDVARAYREAQATAGVLGEAARMKSPRLDPKRLGRDSTAPLRVAARTAARHGRPDRSYWARWATWTVGLASGLLLAVTLGGYLYHRQQFAALSTAHMRLVVTGPSRLQAGTASTYTVNTSYVTGEPIAAKVELAVWSPSGKPLFRQQEQASADGALRLSIPAHVRVPFGSRLEVDAEHLGKREQVQAELPVEPPPYLAHLSTDRPQYRPGERIFYRAIAMQRFALVADRDFAFDVSLRRAGDSAPIGSVARVTAQHGLAGGVIWLPGSLAPGKYQMLARAADGAIPPASVEFDVEPVRTSLLVADVELARDRYAPGDNVVAQVALRRADGVPVRDAKLQVRTEVDGRTLNRLSPEPQRSSYQRVEFGLPKEIASGQARLVVEAEHQQARDEQTWDIPLRLERVEVRFYPEGGSLASGMSNRVYFTTLDARGNPLAIRGVLVDAKDNEVVEVESTRQGRGVFRFTPGQREPYRLKVTSPEGIRHLPALPLAAVEQKVVLRTGPGVFDAGQPLAVDVDANEAGIPLVVSADCRGVNVGQWATVTDAKPQAQHGVIQLPPEASGAIRLAVFDYRQNPPRQLADRLVYRRAQRRLQVQVGQVGQRQAPGARLNLPLVVTNEKGEKVPATLAASVVDQRTADAGPRPVDMAARFLLASEIDATKLFADPEFYLADSPAAALALDLLLGCQPSRTLLDKTSQTRPKADAPGAVAYAGASSPPMVFDNLGRIRDQYERGMQAYRTQETRMFNALATLAFFGGFALVLFLAMLTILNIISGLRLWVPALSAAMSCLIVGAVLMHPDQFPSGGSVPVAYAPYGASATEVAKAKAESEGPKAESGKRKADFKVDRDEESDRDTVGMKASKTLPEVAPVPAEREPAAPASPAFAAKVQPQPSPAGPSRVSSASETGKPTAVMKEEPRPAKAAKRAETPATTAPRAVTLKAAKPAVEKAGKPDDSRAFAYQYDATLRRKTAAPVDVKQAADPLQAAEQRLGQAQRMMPMQMQTSQAVQGPLNQAQPSQSAVQRAVVRDSLRELQAAVGARQMAVPEPSPPLLLFWDPAMQSGKDGQAKLTFDLPGAPARYRVHVDASADGRIASAQADFVVSQPIEMIAKAPPMLNRVDTVEPGYPVSWCNNGRLQGDEVVHVELPATCVANSQSATLYVFPSLAAELRQSRRALTALPTIGFRAATAQLEIDAATLRYAASNPTDPDLVRSAKRGVREAMERLKAAESPAGGCDAFGAGVGQESLTALALVAIADASRVADVDAALAERLIRWLQSRFDAQGVLQPLAKTPQGVAPPADAIRAQMAWALALHGKDVLPAAWTQLLAEAGKSDDPYLLAVSSLALSAGGKTSQAKPLLRKLAAAQQADGSVPPKPSAPRGSRLVETTALAARAWQASPDHAAESARAVKWLRQARRPNGDFGSPQATAWALRAMVEAGGVQPVIADQTKVTVRREGAVLAEQLITPDAQEVVAITVPADKLAKGKNRLVLSISDGTSLPYALATNYHLSKPDTTRPVPLTLTVQLDRVTAERGQTVSLVATIANTASHAVPMAVAHVRLPAGLEVRPESLAAWKKSRAVSDYEIRPQEIVCCWRWLEANSRPTLRIDLTAAISGQFTGAASQAYLLDSPEHSAWAEPLRMEIR